jgi:hypothetical protein
VYQLILEDRYKGAQKADGHHKKGLLELANDMSNGPKLVPSGEQELFEALNKYHP